MSNTDFEILPASRIAIAGLGLMGGSLAHALRAHCRSILAFDLDQSAITYALDHGIIDRGSTAAAEILPQGDVVILAAPIKGILKLIHQLPDLHPGSPIVLDIGSTKVDVMNAMGNLPPRFDPLGGHPMCGKENGGIGNAEASIFTEAPFAFTALGRTSVDARKFAGELAAALESYLLWVDAETHDRWTAATSHLTFLVASALAAATPMESAPLIGTGFRSTTRVAASPASMMLDVLETNRSNVLESLLRFRSAIDQLEEYLSQADLDKMKDALDASAAHHQQLLASTKPERVL
jgi:prephenate dehydrogenase